MNNNEICSRDLVLPFYDCDTKRRIKISTILKNTSEIAGYDYTLRGFGHEYLWERQMVFLLSRVSIKIISYPLQQENIKVSTWECGKKGAMFLRGAEILDKDGNLAISSINGWTLVNPVTRKIYRPSHFEFNIPQLMDKPIYADALSKIEYNSPKLSYSHIVRLSDLDANGHVYNATYADFAINTFSKEEYERNITDFRINFINEAKLGETIELYREDNDNKTVIVGKVQDKTCFEAEYLFK